MNLTKETSKKDIYQICCLIKSLELPSKRLKKVTSQPAITCSKLITETLEQGIKYV